MSDTAARDRTKNAYLEPDIREAFPTDDEVNEALRMLIGLTQLGVEGEITLEKFGSLLDTLGEQTQENTTDMEELKAETAALQKQVERLTIEAHTALEQRDALRKAQEGFKAHD